jgi:serine protease Do
VARLAAKVSPAVVQIDVAGYGLAGEAGRTDAAFVARQHAIGSGVVVDPAGYILTNNHVVHGAQRIQVVLAATAGRTPVAADANARRVFAARVVGSDPNVDLALLKIDATGLPFLPLDGAVKVRQGELVFAIGSPEGLASTVTMGIVGSPAREVDFAQPMAFIQTDAPINPGNSGGPLVDVDGKLVGINTFILSQSGGSQGLGFAIPANVARFVFDGLREHGHIHRIDAGIAAQTITPALAAGLGLPRDWGVVVSDVALGSAARTAGVEVGDLVESFDGHLIDSLASVTSALYLHPANRPVALVVLRGDKRLTLEVHAPAATHPTDQLVDLANPEKGLVRKLGIVGVDVSDKLVGIISPLRIGRGVVVAARTLDATSVDSGLQSGDVIHAVNRTEIDTVETLRRVIRAIKPGEPVALQIERQGKLAYLAFDME